jgi:hypothetical protein
MSHGSAFGYGFSEDSERYKEKDFVYVNNSDIAVINPPSQFYNLFILRAAVVLWHDFAWGSDVTFEVDRK